MKKIYSLLLLVVSFTSFGQTIYSENFGTPTGTTPIATYATGTAPATFQNTTPIAYSGTADVRVTGASSGYSGASANGNVLINAIAEFIQIDGINTSAYNTANIQLSFGYNADGAVTNVVTLEFSINGTTWNPITYTPTGTGWTLVTVPGNTLPSSSTLSIRFTQTQAKNNRIDDVKLSNVSASCTLNLGNATTACNASTLVTDTYTASITYTGGGSGTYTITPSSGTVAGDNPGTVAAGTILINGVAEGTNLTVNVVSGPCSYQATVNSPECKPVLGLPYYEPFAYAEASNLGQTQQWSNNNTGDNIIIAGGNLTPAYAGLNPSTTGYAIFGGEGLDCSTSFTSTTTGTVYYSFILNVNTMAGVTAAAGGYFATLGSSSTNFGATLWTKRVDDGVYNLGIETRSDAAGTTFDTTALVTGATYFVVVGYTLGASASDDTVSLWINPTINGAQPAATITDTHTGTDLTSISNFILRQDSTGETPSMSVDELRIGTTWAQVTNGTLGTNQNTIAGLRMYPNPVTNGTLFIETSANAEKTVTVFDVLGKQVLNTTTSNNTINVASLHTGVYIVNITEEGKTASRKLVIK
jgi:hypothetical protein